MLNGQKENKLYQIFDTAEDREGLPLKITSNKNVQAVCGVHCKAPHKSAEERQYYAEQGELPTEKKDGQLVYEKDVFAPHYPTVGLFWAGLAEALFYGCPQILEFNPDAGKHGEYEVHDQKLYDSLIRSEVQRGWADFLTSFGTSPFAEAMYLGLLPSDLSSTLAVQEGIAQALEASKLMSESSKSGEQKSSVDTEPGSQ